MTHSKRRKHPLKMRYATIFASLVIALIFAYDVIGPGGNIAFYSKWVSCGGQPLQTRGSGFLNAGVPHYIQSPVISFIRFKNDYYCTPLEAERAGLSANPDYYDFPYIDEAGETWPLDIYKKNDNAK